MDEYARYKALFEQGVTELSCWAHARRRFVNLHKASGSAIAEEAIRRIAAIYAVESACAE